MQAPEEKRQTAPAGTDKPTARSGHDIKPDAEKRHQISQDASAFLIQRGLALLQQQDLSGAEAAFRVAVDLNPASAVAYNNLGVCLMRMNRLADAAASFSQAIHIEPDHAEAINNLAVVQLESGQFRPAIDNLRLALQFRPDYAEAWNNMGNAFARLGEPAMAAECYRHSLDIVPAQAEPLTNLGTVLMELGQHAEGEQAFRLAIRSAPDQPAPLASALTWLDPDHHDADFSRLDELYARRSEYLPAHQILLGFAMGRMHDRAGRHAQAFAAWQEANRLHLDLHPFDETREQRIFSQMQATFSRELIEQIPLSRSVLPPSVQQRPPIFIVGMMRSGSTLLEQMLAAHPDIGVAGEVPWLQEAVEQLQNAPPGGDADLLGLTGQTYLDKLWQRHPAASRVVDKQLGNFLHLGLIHLLFPHAAILHVHRNPLDCCFSCYTLRFSQGHEYAFDLETMARQYNRYRQLMRHWQSVLPTGRILDVSYETLVSQPEPTIRNILDHLGLSWHPACLQPELVRRTVRTASLVQVRKPLYRDAIGRWKPYATWLKPLIDNLTEID